MTKSNTTYLLLIILILSSLIIYSQSQICSQSQYFNGQRCAPCKPNCKCTSENTCADCLPGYAFDTRFQNCVQCPLAIDSINIGCKQCCSQISGTSFVCSSCVNQAYVFIKGGQCIKIQGCLNLLQNGMCDSCQPIGYFLQQGKCTPCDTSCKTCKDTSLCTQCQDSYFNQTDINHSLCTACDTGCLTCTTSASTCSSCIYGYYLSTNTCIQCPNYCLTCSSDTSCTSCDSTSTLITGLCYQCTNIVKSGTNGCIQCETYNNLIQCIKCNNGYYLNNNNQCQLCASIFSYSNLCNSTTILQCQSDFHPVLSLRYHLVNNTCVGNTKLCKTMLSSNGDCQQCYFQSPDNYYRLNNKICTKCTQTGCKLFNRNCQCLQCLDGYRYVNNLCVICQNLHCIKCQNNVQACQKCKPYYGRFSSACILCTKPNCLNCDGDYKSCITCDNSYYLNAGTCYKCQTNCLLCDSNIKCNKCANGYYLQNNGRCKQLPTNCLEINSDYLTDNVAICKKCKYGYQILFGSCYPCSQNLFNLNQCEKFCPTYYAMLKYNFNLISSTILSIIIVALIIIL